MVTTVRLPDGLHERLKRHAGQKGMTFNSYILSALWDMEERRLEEITAGEKRETAGQQ